VGAAPTAAVLFVRRALRTEADANTDAVVFSLYRNIRVWDLWHGKLVGVRGMSVRSE
jgi:hypothetical protein